MISKIHLVSVMTIFALVIGGIVAGVLVSINNSNEGNYFKPETPDFKLEEDISQAPWDNGTAVIEKHLDGVFIEGTTVSEDNILNMTDGVSVPIWWDEFDGNTLDKNTWQIMTGNKNGWGNNEVQVYSDSVDNVDVYDSYLRISAIRDNNGVYTSGRIMTKGGWFPGMTLPNDKKANKIRFEVSVILPSSGQGIWPAFWAFPAKPSYGDFPLSGELDIMELINDMNVLTQGIHYGGGEKGKKMTMFKTKADNFTYAGGSYIFAVDWTYDSIIFSTNEVETGVVYSKEVDPENGWYTNSPNGTKNSPFDKPFNLIFNVAVGGNWAGEPDNTTPEISTMLVDYVRVFADFA